MAFQTFKTSRPVVPLEDFGRDLACRKEKLDRELAVPDDRRTESKKALLKAIEDAGGNW